MKCDSGKITLHDHVPAKRIIHLVDQMGFSTCARLTPAQMRRLAAMLTRAADRIEKRKAKFGSALVVFRRVL